MAEVLPDPGQVEWLVLVEVGDPESAAKIDVAHRLGCLGGQLDNQVDGPALGVAQDLRVEVLRTGEDVKAEHVDVGREQLGEQIRNEFGVDAELLRTTTHPHP